MGSALMLEQLSDTNGLHGLPAEPAFLRLLQLERRRTERSRQPFVLMLLERPNGAVEDVPRAVADDR